MTPVSRKENCTTGLIEMNELLEIKTLPTVEQCLKAWFDVVTSHAFLWTNHVEHGDPNLNNMMFDPESNCGVLTDFDLALCQWQPRELGTDRTSTVPILAIDLLTEEYWKGLIQRRYHHELESFIWLVPFLVLSHQNGQRVSNTYIDKWRTSNFDTCRKEKRDFLQDYVLFNGVKATISLRNQGGWTILSSLRTFLADLLAERGIRARRALPEEDILQIRKDAIPINLSIVATSEPSHITDSRELWNGFVEMLRAFSIDQYSKQVFETHAVELFESLRPSFADVKESRKEELANFGRVACMT